MLSTFEKILEKIVYKQLKQYFDVNNVIRSEQSGFRDQHSCESALQNVISNWIDSLDKNEQVVSVFLDLRRAFETVDRNRLIVKLEQYGVKGRVLLFLINYLNNRKQKTKVGHSDSDCIDIEIGVPQGSILGPLLFILYINDIVTSVEKCQIRLFADDTLIYIAGSNLTSLLEILNKELDSVSEWLYNNGLKINVSKTKGMVLGNTMGFPMDRLKLYVSGEIIEVVNDMKYLGVVIDRKLNFRKHADYIAKKIGKKLGILRRVNKFISRRAALTIYNTIVLPHFTYCATILFICCNEDLNRLQKLQNIGMRVLLKMNRFTSIQFMLNKLGWLNIRQFLDFSVMVFIYKVKTNMLPSYLGDRLVENNKIYSYQTRSANSFYLCNVNTQLGFKSVFYNGIRKYNNLPEDIKSTISLNLFRRKLKNYLLTLDTN